MLIIAQQSEDYYYGFVLQTDQDIDDFFAYFNLSPEKTNQLIDVTQASTPEKQLEIGIQELVALYTDFPETRQMAQFARDIYNKAHHITDFHICKFPDEQLLKWIDTEYSLFRCFEEKVYAPITVCLFLTVKNWSNSQTSFSTVANPAQANPWSITLQRYSRRHNWNTKNKP